PSTIKRESRRPTRHRPSRHGIASARGSRPTASRTTWQPHPPADQLGLGPWTLLRLPTPALPSPRSNSRCKTPEQPPYRRGPLQRLALPISAPRIRDRPEANSSPPGRREMDHAQASLATPLQSIAWHLRTARAPDTRFPTWPGGAPVVWRLGASS